MTTLTFYLRLWDWCFYLWGLGGLVLSVTRTLITPFESIAMPRICAEKVSVSLYYSICWLVKSWRSYGVRELYWMLGIGFSLKPFSVVFLD